MKKSYARMTNSRVDIEDARRQTTLFEDIAVFQEWVATPTGTIEPEQIAFAWVPRCLFGILGVSPFLGRVFLLLTRSQRRLARS
jgi:hypothetical protein